MKEKQPRHEEWKPKAGDRVYFFIPEQGLVSGEVNYVNEEEGWLNVDDTYDLEPSQVANADFVDDVLKDMSWADFWDFAVTFAGWDKQVEEIL